MKNFNLLALAVSVAFLFSSCSSNETFIPEEAPVNLLKSYTIKKDASGAYSLDFELNEGGTVDNTFDDVTKTNKYHLYSSDRESVKNVSQDLNIDGTQLKIGFVDKHFNNLPFITLIDDDIRLANKNENNKLKDYSITSNTDGTFNLDFNVNNNVKVDFVYNEDIDTYEIHLESGKSATNKFSRVLEKENGKTLKFDFVNHINAKSRNATDGDVTIRRKPRVIIGTGETVG